VVAAAGRGSRFGGPKQRALLLGRPLYAHALSDLLAHPAVEAAVLAVAAGEEEGFRRELAAYGWERRVEVVAGGESRTASVRRALAALPRDSLEAVLVHDAARPSAPADLVDALLAALSGAEGAVPLLPVADTLRWRQGRGGPARDEVGRVATPQAFRFQALLAAYERARAEGREATDDAQLVEAVGGRIAVVPTQDGRLEKVTRPEDIALAALRLAGPEGLWPRVGVGLDHHRLVPGRALWLCGVHIPYAEGLEGHSDGDVALHALANAILGAAGERDIGTHLPPGDPATAGMASGRVLALALERVRLRGLGVVQAQVTITSPRPRLAPHVPAMVASLARALGLVEGRVAVHATSGEGLIADAMEAHAVAVLAPQPTVFGRDGI
jgi:2-C-methyl-D-erythritol 4-phosphate cytidylyltransferase/2-C-methyl-D-erythritol 2,4-cyclodiphosphate synthase